MPAERPQRSDASAALNAAIDFHGPAVRRGRQGRKPDFLKRLGLSLPVTPEDVKQAYLAKARATHPDKTGGDADEFKAVQAAFDEALEYARRNSKRLPWLGAQMPIYLAQRAVAERVEQLGGSVQFTPLEWLNDTVGEDFALLADRLVSIDLTDCPIDDANLMGLLEDPDGVAYLELLFLSGTKVTDSSMLLVSTARNLRYLDLRETEVSSGMRHRLSRLPGIARVEGAGGWWGWFHSLWGA